MRYTAYTNVSFLMQLKTYNYACMFDGMFLVDLPVLKHEVIDCPSANPTVNPVERQSVQKG